MKPDERTRLGEIIISIYRRKEKEQGPDHPELVHFRKLAKDAGYSIVPGVLSKSNILLPGEFN